MIYILVGLAAIAAVEIFRLLPLIAVARSMLRTARKASHVIMASRISDHWKERVMLPYAGRILLGTLKLTACIVLLTLAVAGLLYAAQILGKWPVLDYALTVGGVLLGTVIALIYAFIRHRLA